MSVVAGLEVSAGSTVVIDFETFCDLLEVSVIKSTTDLGGSIIHRGSHPQHGDIILVGTTGHRNAMIRL
jgi:hypothetical protein